eukprot:TRINITY_DN13830_c0_g1_i8.p1 TRINITY_DN13830_c0_g1~~TRINITY_DN13830_c0_g1_i8.p1  ORF type:complete len:151 (-),score=16.49 TRINITY_DN13830_c0_g1_i8:300-752(-)
MVSTPIKSLSDSGVPTVRSVWNLQTELQANLHFTYELSRRLTGQQIAVFGVTPGMVNTQLGRFNWWYGLVAPLRALLLRSPAIGAAPSVHCATSIDLEGVTGKYFGASKHGLVQEVVSSTASRNQTLNKQLWECSNSLLGKTDADWMPGS